MKTKTVEVWCEYCNGVGNYLVPDYDWDENYIGEMEFECDGCDGNGYNEIAIEELK